MKKWETRTNVINSLFGFYDKVIGAAFKAKFDHYADYLRSHYLNAKGIDIQEGMFDQ